MPLINPEDVNLIKQDGDRKDGVRAQVGSDAIIFDNMDLQIRAGDQIERCLPNGMVELYDVIEPNYHTGGTLSHIKVEVQKGNRKPSGEGKLGDTYHFHGDNARVNQNSVDQSVNIASSKFGDVVSRCREVIENIESEQDRQDLLERLAELETAESKGGLQEIKKAYHRFIAKAANYTTLVSFAWTLARTAG